MQLPALNYPQQKLTCPQLPLAVYREVVAHLRQVEGVDAKIILRPRYHDSTLFDYYQSQVAAIEINYSGHLDEQKRKQVTAILNFYAQRYQPWQEY